MAIGDDGVGFREADLRYAELKRQHEAGTISDEEFDAQLKQMMVQDDEHRWWAKSRNTGEWHYHDGSAWVRDTPPIYQRPQTLPVGSAPDPEPRLEQSEWPPYQTTLSESASAGERNGGEHRRGVPGRAVLVAGLVGVVALVGVMAWALVPGIADGVGSPPEEASEPAPGYALFEHDSRALSVEVPSEWDERIVVDSEGEKGRSSWSSFLGEGESAGPSMTAVNDLYSWRNGTPGHQGIYMVASKRLAQGYTDDDIVASGPNDYSSSCEAGTVQDFERPPYSGKILEWANCGGDSDHVAITLAAAPEGRECVIVAQIGGYFQTQADEENIKHVLDTFEGDCEGIA